MTQVFEPSLLLAGSSFFMHKEKKEFSQPVTVVCKMEAQSEHLRVAHTPFFACLAPNLHAQSVLSNKISASELKRRFIKSALLVGSRSLVARMQQHRKKKKNQLWVEGGVIGMR